MKEMSVAAREVEPSALGPAVAQGVQHLEATRTAGFQTLKLIQHEDVLRPFKESPKLSSLGWRW